MLGFASDEDSIKSGALLPGGFVQSKGRKAVYFSLASPLDQNPDTKYKPFLQLKKHYDMMFVLDLEAAQISLDVYETADGGFSCSSPRSSTSKMAQKGWRKHKHNQKEEKHHQRRKADAIVTRRR